MAFISGAPEVGVGKSLLVQSGSRGSQSPDSLGLRRQQMHAPTIAFRALVRQD